MTMTPAPRPRPAGPDAQAFLMTCLAARHDPAALDRARDWAVAGAVDWPAVGRLVADARLEGLVYPTLRDAAWVDRSLLAELQRAHAGYAARNAVLLGALDEAVEAWAAEGIACIALKGASLIQGLYGDIGQRPMNDLDVLLRSDQVRRAAELLLAAGYRWGGPLDLAMALDFENELILRREGPVDVVIELHWSLIDSPYYQRRLPMDWFWASSRPLARGDGASGALRTLGAEAQVLHLCAHLALHHGRGGRLSLRLLADVSEVLHAAGDGLDWALVLGQARTWHLTLALQRVLPEVATRLGAPIPGTVLAELHRLDASPAERHVVARLTAADPSVAERFRADLAGLPRTRDRLRFLGRNLAPSAAYMRQRYGCRGRLGLARAYLHRWRLGAGGLFRLTGGLASALLGLAGAPWPT